MDLIECQELAIAQRMVSKADFSISTIELQPVDTPGDIEQALSELIIKVAPKAS